MDKCSISHVPNKKGDKFSLVECHKNDFEQRYMKVIVYEIFVQSIIYV